MCVYIHVGQLANVNDMIDRTGVQVQFSILKNDHCILYLKKKTGIDKL